MKNTDELSVKLCLLNYLRYCGLLHNKVVVAVEVPIDQATRRADLLLVSDEMHLFEIKSRSDSTSRLDGQLETYTDFCNLVTIVTSPNHLKKILKSTDKRIGIWSVADSGEINIVREASGLDEFKKKSLLRTLNMVELKRILTEAGKKPGRLPRAKLDEMGADLELDVIYESVTKMIRLRYSEHSSSFLRETNKSERITEKHINYLSRRDAKIQVKKIHSSVASTNSEEDVYMRLMNMLHG